MLEFAILVIALTGLSLFVHEKTGVPSPVTLLTVALLGKMGGVSLLHIDSDTFDQVVYLLFPLLITVDVLHLKFSDIKSNAISLFYVAVISVVLSVLAGAALDSWIFPDYDISLPALVALFCMIMATDPVAVSAVFGSHKLPHKLKVIAEGESLFNDATAVVVFSIALFILKMDGNSPSTMDVVILSASIIFGAIAIGFVVGLIGVGLLKMVSDTKLEMTILLLLGYTAYALAESMHWSGIPAIIIAVMMGNSVIHGRIKNNDANKESGRAENDIESNHKIVHRNIETLAIFGSTVLFLAIGEMVDFDNIALYWKEILSVFIAATAIRTIMMKKFKAISNLNSHMQNISIHWWLILSSAGVKGGLSILMLHLLTDWIPASQVGLFEAIVIGNILLSTFIYPFILIAVIKSNREKLDIEISQD